MKDAHTPLEQLNERLYSNRPIPMFREESLHAATPTLPQAWGKTPVAPVKRTSYATLFFVGAVFFFLVACGVAAFLYLRGTRAISSDHIQIEVVGPTTIASGDTVPLTITVHNNNPAPITTTNLSVDFPNGTRQSSDVNIPLDHYNDTLGDMDAGSQKTRTVSAVLFGAQNQTVTVPVRFQYHVAGSNAVFTATSTYSFIISTSPVSLQVQAVSETSSGQAAVLNISVHSNATVPLQNLAIDAKYPDFGFAVGNTSITPSAGTFYPIGTLNPGETKSLRVSGVVSGNAGDERTFGFAVGAMKNDGTSQLAASYTSITSTIKITQPFIGTTLSLDGSASENVTALPGSRINGSLMWKNNLDTPVANIVVAVALAGAGLDPASVQVSGGAYRSTDRTIFFTKENSPGLSLLQPRDSGIGTFSFAVKPSSSLKNNSDITATISATGVRSGQGIVSAGVSSAIVRTITIGTGVNISNKILHATGGIQNSGPVPPTPGVETTYTISLNANSSVNAVGAAEETMKLPSYVRFTGVLSANAAITYDDVTRTVTWKVGELTPGVAANAAFQIAFLPSTTQINSDPILVGDATFTGTDKFTKALISAKNLALELAVQGDPGFSPISGTVHN